MEKRRINSGPVVKTRELNIEYDITPVSPPDRAVVRNIIFLVVSLESTMPKLKLQVNPANGYYNLVFKGFNVMLDVANTYQVLLGEDRSSAADWIKSVEMIPETGALVVKVVSTQRKDKPNSLLLLQKGYKKKGRSKRRRTEN